MTAAIFDNTVCSLGEGALWHPIRKTFFWFDINGHRLFEKPPSQSAGDAPKVWEFDTFVTAGGWIDDTHLLIAKKGALIKFNLETGVQSHVVDLESDTPVTRPNDGRADPHGGFWIGTMGIDLEPDAGAIYRYYRGELRKLYAPWTIPNATCFSPCGNWAFFVDTPEAVIYRQKLDADGWPQGDRHPFADMSQGDYRPDGAVIDSDGAMWVAHYGYGMVTQLGTDGCEIARHNVGGKQATCPAFGGDDLNQLFVTTAAQNIDTPTDGDGRTHIIETGCKGQMEHQVIL